MTITIELPLEIEADLAAQAAARGVSVEQYLHDLLMGLVSPRQTEAPTPHERAALWRKSTDGLPRTPPLSDQAVSRETIYASRG